MAAAGDLEPNDLIWKEGMAEWKPAGQLKGLFPAEKSVTPSVPPPPQLPPPALFDGSPGSIENSENARLREIELAQKWLLWAILVAIVLGVLLVPIFSSPVFWSIAILMGLFQVYCLVRLTMAMQWSIAVTVLLSLLMLVPYVSTFGLLVLNQFATKRLQKVGVPVGFMGARTADLPQAEPQSMFRGTMVGRAVAVAVATCAVAIAVGIAVVLGTTEDDFETQSLVANELLPLEAEECVVAMRHFDRGNVYYAKGDLDRAITEFTKAIQFDSELALAYSNCGVAYAEKSNFDRAIADYTEAVRLNPELAKAYNNRGNAYSAKGDFDSAIAEFTEAIRLDPDSAKPYYNRGNAYYARGDFDRAIAELTKAIQLDPEFAAAYSNRGLAYVKKSSRDRAFADYTEAIRLNPELAEAYNGRGACYYDKGDVDHAITDFTEAIRLDSELVLAYYLRGFAYKQRGEADRAEADFQKARELGLPPGLNLPPGAE